MEGIATLSVTNVPKKRWFYVIFPLLMVCILSYMDRVNIAFAMPGGMGAELGIKASMIGLAAGIFFIGYLFLQIPAGQIAAKGRAKRFIAFSLVAWAVISILTGFIQTLNQLLVLRFLLGVAEGGMLPVVLTMVSQWFPEHERGRATAMVIMFVPISGMLSGPLSGYVISAYDWRYLFIFEGILTFSFLFIWLKMVHDNPEDAKWISDTEKEYIQTELAKEQENLSKVQNVKNTSLKSALGSNKIIWVLVLINFMYQFGIYGYTMWLPTILGQLTHSGISTVGWLTFLPYLACMLGMFGVSYFSDKIQKRKWFVVLSLCGFGLALYVSVLAHQHVILSYISIVAAGFFLQAAAAPFWTIVPKLFAPEVAGGARGMINALGNLGGFCGPYFVGVLIGFYDNQVGIYCMVVVLLMAAGLCAMLPKRCS